MYEIRVKVKFYLTNKILFHVYQRFFLIKT
jgi:hypothetical protein